MFLNIRALVCPSISDPRHAIERAAEHATMSWLSFTASRRVDIGALLVRDKWSHATGTNKVLGRKVANVQEHKHRTVSQDVHMHDSIACIS